MFLFQVLVVYIIAWYSAIRVKICIRFVGIINTVLQQSFEICEYSSTAYTQVVNYTSSKC